ncbi:hypothetical protein MLM_1736 [Mycobacterium lepraemurium]|nr:hypothetical protein [Mycobacterium lepraemurium]ATA28311.1 hypothetical protein MLM_1736 [Mycobacterium lepraemurium]
MDVAGLSPERRARSSAPHRTAGTPDRRGRRPATKPVTQPHTVPDTADQQQADYFMRLLTGRRGLIDQRLDGYRQKIAKAEAKGDVDAVAGLRRLTRIAEQDRQAVDGLIDKLRRRFARRD